MLFNSPVFLLCFLPATLAGFLLLRRFGSNAACELWLLFASCVFYAWWSPFFLMLLLASTGANYMLAQMIENARGAARRGVFFLAIGGNLATLGYFKYADFLISTFNDVARSDIALLHVVLPLGISFFTFQKIAYVADVYMGKARSGRFLDFALFVFFFPQLIAGPIVHHAEMTPQFATLAKRPARGAEERWEDAAIGVTVFLIGLMKKTIVADQIALYASPVFEAARGEPIGLLLGWQAALCYAVQLYFDFSGYSDMAIGLARLFGVRLPANFDSPYAALSVIDFWRRWHMTLSRLLREYVYIPLGGGREGAVRANVNLMLVMLLCGLWHGARYTFVVWGGVHGLYLLAAHVWARWGRLPLPVPLAWLLTTLAVVVAWVPFRAESLSDAAVLLYGMAGLNGLHTPPRAALEQPMALAAAAALVLACAVLPNTQQIMRAYRPVLGAISAPRFAAPAVFSPSLRWAVLMGFIAGAVELFAWQTSEFLYFQF